LSSFLGTDFHAPAQDPRVNSFLSALQDPNYGQDQVAKSTAAATQAALPSFLQDLQSTREDNIRRGISTADLGSSFEGDLTSAFQRNIASSAAAQSASMFNSRNSLLMGGLEDQLDREQSAENSHEQRKSGLIGGLIGLGGSIFGNRGGGGGYGGGY